MGKTIDISAYKKLYELLIYKRKSQTSICKILKKDKAQISRMTNRLIQGFYIQCLNPRSRDKLYVATKKPFNADEVYKLPSSKSQRLRGICNIIQIQKSSFKAKTRHPPKRVDLVWDKEWNLNNGVRCQQWSQPFSNLGVVHLQRIFSDNKDVVKIILPRLTWEREAGNPDGFLHDAAERCAVWFKKRLLIDFEPLVSCTKPHHAIPLTDKKLVDMAQRGTYRNDVLMIDSSPPDNIAEIESEYYDVMDGLSTVVPRVNRLEVEVVEIKNMIIDFRAEFQSVFSQPVRPDEKRDVV